MGASESVEQHRERKKRENEAYNSKMDKISQNLEEDKKRRREKAAQSRDNLVRIRNS